jgi:hypothetical protein
MTTALTFGGRGSFTLTSNGKSFPTTAVNINAPGGTLALQDAFTNLVNAFTISNGTLTTNGYTVTSPQIVFAAGTKTCNAGASTFVVTSGAWSVTAAGATMNMGTSTVKFSASSGTRNFTAGGSSITYYNFWNACTGAAIVAMLDDAVFSNEVKSNTDGRTFTITAAKTITAATWTISGAAGTLTTINSASSASHTLTKSGGGTVSCDYMSLTYSTATPGSTFYAGTHSTDGGNNSGWTFTDAPSPSTDGGLRRKMYFYQ